MFECADLLLCSVNLDAAPVLHHTCIMKGVVQPNAGSSFTPTGVGGLAFALRGAFRSFLRLHCFTKSSEPNRNHVCSSFWYHMSRSAAYGISDAGILDAHRCASHETIDRYCLPSWRKPHSLARLDTTQAYENSAPNRSKQGQGILKSLLCCATLTAPLCVLCAP